MGKHSNDDSCTVEGSVDESFELHLQRQSNCSSITYENILSMRHMYNEEETEQQQSQNQLQQLHTTSKSKPSIDSEITGLEISTPVIGNNQKKLEVSASELRNSTHEFSIPFDPHNDDSSVLFDFVEVDDGFTYHTISSRGQPFEEILLIEEHESASLPPPPSAHQEFDVTPTVTNGKKVADICVNNITEDLIWFELDSIDDEAACSDENLRLLQTDTTNRKSNRTVDVEKYIHVDPSSSEIGEDVDETRKSLEETRIEEELITGTLEDQPQRPEEESRSLKKKKSNRKLKKDSSLRSKMIDAARKERGSSQSLKEKSSSSSRKLKKESSSSRKLKRESSSRRKLKKDSSSRSKKSATSQETGDSSPTTKKSNRRNKLQKSSSSSRSKKLLFATEEGTTSQRNVMAKSPTPRNTLRKSSSSSRIRNKQKKEEDEPTSSRSRSEKEKKSFSRRQTLKKTKKSNRKLPKENSSCNTNKAENQPSRRRSSIKK